MEKRHFNEEWLDKPDANGQAISLWCIKKDNFTATCKLCNTHINIAHMGYSALKQHSEKKKHKGFSSTLQKVKDKEKVEEADKCTDSQKVLQDFFVKSSTSTSKATASSVETSDFAQDIGPSRSQTTVTEVLWMLPQLVAKAEIIAALQYASQNIPYSCADALQECYKQVSRLSNSNACFTWIKKDVIYGGIWPRPILPTGNSERNNSREFILHFTL